MPGLAGGAAPKLGFGLPVSGSWATPANMITIAQRAERLGYESLWTYQRLLQPVDGGWGEMYRCVQDPIVSLAYVAAVTRRMRLGTAILNAPFYTPVMLAKQLTTLDQVSGGRLDAGLGLGWSREEFAAANIAYENRGARTEELVTGLKNIWTADVAAYQGRFFTLEPSEVRPRPVQRPHPPILLGGAAEPALRRVGRLADGWISSSRHNLRKIGDDIALISSAATEAGRDPAALRFVVRGVLRLGDADNPDDARRPLQGSVRQVKDDLRRLGELGVTEVFLDLNFSPDVGQPDTDPANAMSVALGVLDTFAPAVTG